jgi:hypothetical protein
MSERGPVVSSLVAKHLEAEDGESFRRTPHSSGAGVLVGGVVARRGNARGNLSLFKPWTPLVVGPPLPRVED